jgi:xylulokinase
MSSAGGAVEWLLREFGAAYGHDPESGDYDAFNQAVAASEPGAGGLIFLPYLSGELHPILDANARGVFVGLTGATARGDIARAVLEGSAMAIRHNLTVAAAAGARVTRLVATGGPSRSAEWCQIIADVTGHQLSVVSSGSAPVGDALIAGAGVGLIPDPGALARTIATIGREYAPRPVAASRYDELFPAYLRIYERLAPEFVYLSGLTS